MLTPESTTGSTGSGKLISVNVGIGTVAYTVPAGKIFEGFIFGGARINGMGYVPTDFQGKITLPSGTVISSTSSGGSSVIGVEQ